MPKKKQSTKIYGTLAKLAAGVFAGFYLVNIIPFEGILTEYQVAAPLGALFAGALLVSMFTVVIGTVFIGVLASAMPLWQIVLLGAIGSVLVDSAMFILFRGTIAQEAKPFMKKWRRKPIIRMLHTKYFRWIIPILGALLIASPLPDEIGISMLGSSKISMRKFIAVSFVMDCLGILVIVLSARAIT